MTVTIAAATQRPPKPPEAMPTFQPENRPEMTAPTPSAHSDQTRAWRRRPRFAKYAASAAW